MSRTPECGQRRVWNLANNKSCKTRSPRLGLPTLEDFGMADVDASDWFAWETLIYLAGIVFLFPGCQLAGEVKTCARISTETWYDGFINRKCPAMDGNVQKKESLRIGRHANSCQIIGRLCE